jgi:hypothetical protein
MNRKNLEDRLIDFAVVITEIVNEMPATRTANHYAGQLLRSGSSPAPNYGETQSAESKKRFYPQDERDTERTHGIPHMPHNYKTNQMLQL